MAGLEEDRQLAVPTLAAACTGAVFAALVLLGWPSAAVLDWMRVRQTSGGAALPDAMVQIGASIVLGTMLLSVVILAVHRLMRWAGGYRQWMLLAVILIAVFALTFAAEAFSQLARASGNLTASDATGLLIDNRRLTAHGWETIARRAAVPTASAGIMAAMFALVRALTQRRVAP